MEEEFAKYLSQKAFDRFVYQWKQKYIQLGHLGGSISIDDLSSIEIEQIGSLLGKDLSDGQLSISYKQFIKHLHNDTKYENIDFLKVLNIINGKRIKTNKERKQEIINKRNKFKADILNQFQHTAAYEWLLYYFENDKNYNRFIDEDYECFFEILSYVSKGYNNFPLDNELLAVFSQKITMDPHYFDSDLPKDILIKSICYFSNNELFDNNSENISYLLQQVGIMRDELSNYCYICHIDNILYQWNEFYDSYEIWNMNMYNLNRVEALFLKQKIYIIENPSVFQRICQYIQKNKINVGVVCSNGQINLCTYQLLDKLLESGCELYYAGDFDPEGLYIADRLVTRYNLHLWCYDEKYFDMIKIAKKLTSRRIKILEQLKHPQLQKMARNIQIKKSVGYQEGLIDIYLNNI